MSLSTRLKALRPAIAQAAQKVVDEWEQDADGIDAEYGSGGVCDRVAEDIAGIITQQLHDVDTTDGGQEGDDHAFVIAYTDDEACGVDVPPGVYEVGSGYRWRKIPGARIAPDDVEIWKVDRELVGDWD